MIRATFRSDTRLIRNSMIQKSTAPPNTAYLKMEKSQPEFQVEIETAQKFEYIGIDVLTKRITSVRIIFKTKPKEEKFSAETKKLIDDKRKMERDTEEFKDRNGN
ncbi:hypothetical protein HHI36_000403 [Cryptolaemus montrouzieri]|uniref:Uncharacterized protein n=1 Tax=Cryptolaemus montrouzieri TaxID=559131 RepID=A0ABD2P4I5_9CUCU